MPISFRIFQFIVIHTVKAFGIVNKAEIDVSLELPYFFNDPANVGSRQIGSGQTEDGKSESQHSRNQGTKVD